MTEDEARTKWCPFTRLSDSWEAEDGRQLSATNNRPHGGRGKIHKSANCIASDCMAWRVVVGKGFCGLAGKDGAT